MSLLNTSTNIQTCKNWWLFLIQSLKFNREFPFQPGNPQGVSMVIPKAKGPKKTRKTLKKLPALFFRDDFFGIMVVTLPPETNINSTWKWMFGIRSFSFGARPIFRCELLVSGSVVSHSFSGVAPPCVWHLLTRNCWWYQTPQNTPRWSIWDKRHAYKVVSFFSGWKANLVYIVMVYCGTDYKVSKFMLCKLI